MPFKAKNNREAVVVCAKHVVKRPSKRSVLVWNITWRNINAKEVYVTTDGFKYFSNRTKLNSVHLRCVLFKKGCKGRAKLKTDINLIYPKSEHDHQIELNSFALKSKCRKMATTSQANLREIFNEVTRILRYFKVPFFFL